MTVIPVVSQKAPSAKRCIKTDHGAIVARMMERGQKAPSAIRYIKTAIAAGVRTDDLLGVRKRQAP